MEIGISTASLFLRQNNEDAVKTIRSLGSKTTEIFFETMSEYTAEYSDLIKSRLGDMKVHSVHVYTMHYEPELFSDNEKSFKEALATYKSVLNSARNLGATNYTLHGRARIKRTGNYDDYEKIGKRLNFLTEVAKEYGVDLCLENVEWALYNRVGYFKEVLKYAPDLKATLDIKQARISGYDVYDYIEEMKGKIKTVHLSDIGENGGRCIPGKGVTDFEKLFTTLKDTGFDGVSLIEVYKDDYKDIEELRESLQYLENIKNKIWR